MTGLKLLFILPLTLPAFGVITIPEVYTSVSTPGTLDISTLSEVIVDDSFADWQDWTGQTLVPPTLEDFATIFASDFGNASVTRGKDQSCSVYLTLDPNGEFYDAAGRWAAEGYSMNITTDRVVISGASPLGAWWGTRTLLQLAAQNSSLSIVHIRDAPGWAERGVMLDAARHYYPPDFIVELCAYLSFFKQNVLHLHLSDDATWDATLLAWNDSMILDQANAYAAFRLDSNDSSLDGLDTRHNESYTQPVFATMQEQCASRGVTIIPELESPGHALVINQWKPHLARTDNYDLLNISQPETIPTVQSIWNAVLPWLQSKTVSIGADEYDTSLPNDYNRFVNSMNDYIGGQSDKRVRIWNTFPPNSSYNENINTNVSIQWWGAQYGNAYYDFIANNYSVVNSYDAFYIVNKINDGFPQYLNATSIFHGNPASGGSYAPHIFDLANASNNAARDEPLVQGSICPLWNDYGPLASVYSEAYYAWRDLLPAMADKQWGGNVTDDEYLAVFDILHAAVPGQNLDCKIPTASPIILHYSFDEAAEVVIDSSGNAYNASNNGCTISNGTVKFDGNCSLVTPLDSKGRNYTLSFDVKPSAHGGSLFKGSRSELKNGIGSISNVTMQAGGNAYSLNYTLPLDTWSSLSLVGRGTQTFLKVNEEPEQEFYALVGLHGFQELWTEMAFEAPLKCIGDGFTGSMREILLNNSA